ncbi:MAG TPA: hypothetical protein VIB07_04430 [Nitrososphaera sp.]
MLGDGTVTQVNTFDPKKVQVFYQQLANSLKKRGWASSEISGSQTEDLHRLFFQTTKEVGKYHMSGYFGIQFHALPYYRVDKRVIEIQKELAAIANQAGSVFAEMSGAADRALFSELKKRGYADLEFQELFTKMFDDETLVEQLDSKATEVEQRFPQFEEMRKKKSALFGELNDLLMELYQTSAVSIDHNRMMQGEEGVTVYVDIEVVKNQKTKKREAFVDTISVPEEWANRLSAELLFVAKTLGDRPGH